MWQAARQQEKKLYAIMVDHKKRAERRKAYYESKLADPAQLLRINGTTVSLVPDAQQYHYYENEDNLMTWVGDGETKIDRFDARAMLDFLPREMPQDANYQDPEEKKLGDEMNFERYRDIVESTRLNISEEERLINIDNKWNELLHKKKKKELNQAQSKEAKETKSDLKGVYAHAKLDYGTEVVSTTSCSMEGEEDLLEMEVEVDVDEIDYIDELSEEAKIQVNKSGREFGVLNYVRLVEKTLDQELKKEEEEQRRNRKKGDVSVRRREYRSDRFREKKDHHSKKRQNSRSPDRGHGKGADSDKEQESKVEFISEFGNNLPERKGHYSSETDSDHEYDHEKKGSLEKKPTQVKSIPPNPSLTQEKKLTPAERLKLRMKMGLNKQIQNDQQKRKQKQLEDQLQEFERDESDIYSKGGLGKIIPSNSVKGNDRVTSPDTSPIETRQPSSSHQVNPNSSFEKKQSSKKWKRSDSPSSRGRSRSMSSSNSSKGRSRSRSYSKERRNKHKRKNSSSRSDSRQKYQSRSKNYHASHRY